MIVVVSQQQRAGRASDGTKAHGVTGGLQWGAGGLLPVKER